ncbi:hypothetical protein Nepgr_005162 [Nepenthes gracilis]|uniref:Ninja-family protein n=1 Tax=Nepenthes gracilis TaxID=150966 RepID=A0AAD3S2S3_NEPGR|nr:hypothetical protein Nepgr_005162 [Nepenthes gracilis]
MEEDRGLDLSLGLPLGGSSSKSKDKNDNLADTRTDDGDRTSKIVNDFRNFLNGGNPQQDPSIFHRIDSVKPQDNLFRDVSPSYVHMSLPRPHDIGVVCSGPSFNVSLAFVEGDASFNENDRRLSITGSKRSTEGEDEKGPLVGEKRKILLDEANHLKKQETETRNSDLHDKPKMSHISITTDDGFMADNEDVAESEAEGSTSRPVSHHEEGSKWHVEGGSSFEVPKEIHGKPMIMAPPYTASSLIVPYSISIKESASVGVTSTSSYPSAGMMQAMPSINIECSSTQTLSAGNVPAIFGYSLVQLPTFDKDNGWGMAADSLSFNPSYAATGISTSAAMQVNHNLSEAVPPSELAKSNGKQATEEGSSSHTGDEALGSGILMGGKTSEVPACNSFPSDYPAIRPGIAANIKFGGSGSFPDLPWVSTTGPVPYGRTISGVTYKYSSSQIRIVCACHGSHMTPEEFIQHAAEEQPAATDGGSSNPVASALS